MDEICALLLTLLFDLQVILYTFPAVCWAYDAGAYFCLFATIVFWGGTVLRAVEAVRAAVISAQPKGLKVKELLCSICT